MVEEPNSLFLIVEIRNPAFQPVDDLQVEVRVLNESKALILDHSLDPVPNIDIEYDMLEEHKAKVKLSRLDRLSNTTYRVKIKGSQVRKEDCRVSVAGEDGEAIVLSGDRIFSRPVDLLVGTALILIAAYFSVELFVFDKNVPFSILSGRIDKHIVKEAKSGSTTDGTKLNVPAERVNQGQTNSALIKPEPAPRPDKLEPLDLGKVTQAINGDLSDVVTRDGSRYCVNESVISKRGNKVQVLFCPIPDRYASFRNYFSIHESLEDVLVLSWLYDNNDYLQKQSEVRILLLHQLFEKIELYDENYRDGKTMDTMGNIQNVLNLHLSNHLRGKAYKLLANRFGAKQWPDASQNITLIAIATLFCDNMTNKENDAESRKIAMKGYRNIEKLLEKVLVLFNNLIDNNDVANSLEASTAKKKLSHIIENYRSGEKLTEDGTRWDPLSTSAVLRQEYKRLMDRKLPKENCVDYKKLRDRFETWKLQ